MGDDPTLFLALLTARSPEAWLAIVGGSFYIWYKTGTKSRFGRALEAGISGLMSLALGPEIIQITGWPVAIVHFLIAVLGFAILDTLTSFFSDKEALAEIIKEYLRKWLNIEKK